MTFRIPKLKPGEEITPEYLNRVVDGVNRNRITSPDLMVYQTSAGTALQLPPPRPVPPPEQSLDVFPFALLEDTVPARISGGIAAPPPDGASDDPDLSVKGYFLDDPARTPVDLFPPDQTQRTEAARPLAFGVGRKPSTYFRGSKGWARWVARAFTDSSGVIQGQWQIVDLDASTIVDAKALGPYAVTIADDAGPGVGILVVEENLVGLVEIGDTVRVENATQLNNRNYTVTRVVWEPAGVPPHTLMQTNEATGGPGAVTSGTLGKIIHAGSRAPVDLWWPNQDVQEGPLVNSGFDIKASNLTTSRISPGMPLKLSWDRQDYSWQVLDVCEPSVFTGFLASTVTIDATGGPDDTYKVFWTKDRLNGGDIEHFDIPITGDKDIEFSSPGDYLVSFTPHFLPNGGNKVEFHVEFFLNNVVVHHNHISMSAPGAWGIGSTLTLTDIVYSPTADFEFYVQITNVYTRDLDLVGSATTTPQADRTDISVTRLRR